MGVNCGNLIRKWPKNVSKVNNVSKPYETSQFAPLLNPKSKKNMFKLIQCSSQRESNPNFLVSKYLKKYGE